MDPRRFKSSRQRAGKACSCAGSNRLLLVDDVIHVFGVCQVVCFPTGRKRQKNIWFSSFSDQTDLILPAIPDPAESTDGTPDSVAAGGVGLHGHSRRGREVDFTPLDFRDVGLPKLAGCDERG